jgi:F0F1-type ATP synthase assembly protein I
MTNAPKPSESTSVMQQLAPYMHLGTQLTLSIVMCGAAGWYADTRYGTEPWLLVVGLVLGMVVGVLQFIRTVRRLDRKNTV